MIFDYLIRNGILKLSRIENLLLNTYKVGGYFIPLFKLILKHKLNLKEPNILN